MFVADLSRPSAISATKAARTFINFSKGDLSVLISAIGDTSNFLDCHPEAGCDRKEIALAYGKSISLPNVARHRLHCVFIDVLSRSKLA